MSVTRFLRLLFRLQKAHLCFYGHQLDPPQAKEDQRRPQSSGGLGNSMSFDVKYGALMEARKVGKK